MDRVITSKPFFTISTTAAFWLGLTRQQRTLLHCLQRSRNFWRVCSSSTSFNASPSMTIAWVGPGGRWSLRAALNSSSEPVMLKVARCLSSSASAASMASLCGLNTIKSISLLSRLQEKPMLMAVSTLSPVSTHSLIPASASKAIVSGTPSCKRSSIAVPPISVRSLSMASETISSLSSRSTIAPAARSCSLFQA